MEIYFRPFISMQRIRYIDHTHPALWNVAYNVLHAGDFLLHETLMHCYDLRVGRF